MTDGHKHFTLTLPRWVIWLLQTPIWRTRNLDWVERSRFPFGSTSRSSDDEATSPQPTRQDPVRSTEGSRQARRGPSPMCGVRQGRRAHQERAPTAAQRAGRYPVRTPGQLRAADPPRRAAAGATIVHRRVATPDGLLPRVRTGDFRRTSILWAMPSDGPPVMIPCPKCSRRLTLFVHVARCFACGWRAEPNPYR